MKKTAQMTEEMAKKVWLAGLGVYSLTNEKAKEKLNKKEEELSKEFEELVEKGQTVEDEMFGKVKEVEAKVKERLNKAIDTQTDFMKRVLGVKEDKSEEKIDELSAKVDALTEAVAKLAAKK